MSRFMTWTFNRAIQRGMAACAIAAPFVTSSCLIPAIPQAHAELGKICNPKAEG